MTRKRIFLIDLLRHLEKNKIVSDEDMKRELMMATHHKYPMVSDVYELPDGSFTAQLTLLGRASLCNNDLPTF